MIQASASQTQAPAQAPVGGGVITGNPPPDAIDWEWVSRRLRRFAVALTGRSDEAEDLAQQAIAVLLAKAPHKADHLGYGRSTLTRLWLDQQRSARRRWKRMVAAAATAVGSFVRGPAPTETNEQVQLLRQAINGLPPRQRAVITLRLIEGLEYAAIAEAIGCDVGAVRSSLHQARARLRNLLEEETPPR